MTVGVRSISRLIGCLSLLFATASFGAPAIQLRDDLVRELRKPRAAGETIVIKGIDLGRDATDTLELEPMQIWAPDAKILVWGASGEPAEMPIPKYENFKGRVVGVDDSLVFLSYRKGRLAGSIIVGTKKFDLGTAVPVGNRSLRYRDPDADLSGERLPLLMTEVDDMASVGDPTQSWVCDVDRSVVTSERPAALGPRPAKATPEAGGVTGATYTLKIGLDTDNELCAGFSNNATSITNYFNDLIAKSNIIYQRDVATSLSIGLLNIRNGGAGTDPYSDQSTDTFAALDEFGDTWSANFAATQRSAALLISGKPFFGGIAWVNALCDSDFYCGDTGSDCCNPNLPPADLAACLANFDGVHIGPYGFVGSLNSVETTNAVPTTTINGHEYAMPSTNNFWMLAAFTHELGHTVASPHSWCVPSGGFTAEQKTQYGIGTTSLPDRNFVDTSADGGVYGNNACFSGANTFPTEWGTIMSYAHNLFDNGFRASRYIFGKTGEASELILPILKNAVDAATPNGTITIGSAPLACAAGQAASVPSAGGLTYAWQITGGTIQGATNTASITFTPSTPSVTVTVTITNTATSHGCSITTSATRSTVCPASTDEVGIFRNGLFFLDSDGNHVAQVGDTFFNFGTTGDIPVAGDWDGSGTTKIGIFRNGLWFLDTNGNHVADVGDTFFTFGMAGDTPVVGDWTGTGTTKVGIFRNGLWFLDTDGDRVAEVSDTFFTYGTTGDLPVTVDLNGSGTTKVGIFRNGLWFLDTNNNHVSDVSDTFFNFGTTGDKPVVGDWDGNGATEVGIFRSALWFLDTNGNKVAEVGDTYFRFGLSSDKPIVGAW